MSERRKRKRLMLTSGELNYVSRAQISYAYSCPNFGHRNVGRIILSVSPPHLFLLLQWLYCFHSVALSKFPFPLLSFLPSAISIYHGTIPPKPLLKFFLQRAGPEPRSRPNCQTGFGELYAYLWTECVGMSSLMFAT